MKEEKELIKEINSNLKKEINDLFTNDFIINYNYEIEDNVSKYINKFIEEKLNESENLSGIFENETKNISTLNVILLGKTGVGKSTLINEILKLIKIEQKSKKIMNHSILKDGLKNIQ